MLLLFLTAS